jgi:hypothetical protein
VSEGPVFNLRDCHLRLLRHANVIWKDNAPVIDSKRPYGNSDGLQDVARVLGVEYRNDEKQDAALQMAHRGTATALQICLVCGTFRTGRYRQKDRYDYLSWERIGDLEEGK